MMSFDDDDDDDDDEPEEYFIHIHIHTTQKVILVPLKLNFFAKTIFVS